MRVHFPLSRNKHFEAYAYPDDNKHRTFGVDVHVRRKCHHAGVEVTFGVFGKALILHLYDTRHWSSFRQEYEKK